jgi:hypothetical protein
MRIVKVVGVAAGIAAGLGLVAVLGYVAWVLSLWLRADAARNGPLSTARSRRFAA